MKEHEHDARVEAMGDPSDSPTAESASADSTQPPTRTQINNVPWAVRETVYGWALHSADGAYLGVMKNQSVAVYVVALVNVYGAKAERARSSESPYDLSVGRKGFRR